jgi:hypothetical protein
MFFFYITVQALNGVIERDKICFIKKINALNSLELLPLQHDIF